MELPWQEASAMEWRIMPVVTNVAIQGKGYGKTVSIKSVKTH